MTARATDPVLLDVLGARVALRLHGLPPEDRGRVLADWAWCRTEGRGAAGHTTVHAVLEAADTVPRPPSAGPAVVRDTGTGSDRSADLVVRAGDVDRLRDQLARALTLHAIDARAADLLLLHAAAVCDPLTGATVALVGASGSGKTTAARALGRTFAYVTDETLGVQDDGGVVPYPKPLSVVRDGTTKAQVAPEAAGLLRSVGPSPWLAAVVLIDRDPTATAPVLEPVAITDVVEPLFGQISYLSRRGRPLVRLQRLVQATGGLRVLRYAEAEALAPVVRRLLDEDVDHPAAARSRDARPDDSGGVTDDLVPDGPDGPGDQAGPSLRRVDVTDWIEEDEDVLVLHDDVLRVLRGIGAEIWRDLDRPRSVSGVVRRVVARFGRPGIGDAHDIVEAVVDELRGHGLLDVERPADGTP